MLSAGGAAEIPSDTTIPAAAAADAFKNVLRLAIGKLVIRKPAIFKEIETIPVAIRVSISGRTIPHASRILLKT